MSKPFDMSLKQQCSLSAWYALILPYPVILTSEVASAYHSSKSKACASTDMASPKQQAP